jgi:molybdopterin-guanine dinucleotide biosynthesis protein A
VTARPPVALPATCLLLAGGKARRFGVDKLASRLGGQTLLAHTCRRLAPLFEDLIVVRAAGPDLPLDCGRAVTQIPDARPDAGPLAGLAAGLEASRTEWAFLAGADMPFVAPELVRLLWARATDDVDAVLPSGPRGLEPLCAFYRISTLPAVAAAVGSGKRRVVSFLDDVRVVVVSERELAAVDPGLRSFFNVNTVEDLEAARGSLDDLV